MKKIIDKVLAVSDTNNTIWELFHLNARCSKLDANIFLSSHGNKNKAAHDIVPYANYPSIPLPGIAENLDLSLTDAIKNRLSQYKMAPVALSLEDISSIFLQSYSLSHRNGKNDSLQHYLTTPSAGALYPIEIFFHYSAPSNNRKNNFNSGLYYYNPRKNELRCLTNKDCSEKINEIFIQKEIACSSSLQIFITSIFSRSTKKYGDRGYKFALLEAGHIAQNINLVTTAMGLSSINIGGYYDKEANDLLGIDGLSHSTVYMIAVGIEKI